MVHGQIIEAAGIDEYYARSVDLINETNISMEEYQAGLGKYSELRMLAYTPDNANIVVTPGG